MLRLLCLDRDDHWLLGLRDRNNKLFHLNPVEERVVVELKPMAPTLAERKHTFSVAAEEFAERLGVPLPKRLNARLSSSIYEQVLFIHMKALLKVFGTKSAHRKAAILTHLLNRERDYWERQMKTQGIEKLHRPAVEEAVHCISENGAVVSLEKAERLLQQQPLLRDLPLVVVRQVARLLRRCYPHARGGIAPLQPDLLRDALRDDLLRRSSRRQTR